MVSIHGTALTATYETQVYRSQSGTIPVSPTCETSDREREKYSIPVIPINYRNRANSGIGGQVDFAA